LRILYMRRLARKFGGNLPSRRPLCQLKKALWALGHTRSDTDRTAALTGESRITDSAPAAAEQPRSARAESRASVLRNGLGEA
jgi:hypothetical protein